MAKKIINSTIDEVNEIKEISPRQMAEVTDKVIFEPTSTQAKLKAKFWTRFQPGPLVNTGTLTLAKAAEITGSTQLKKWWYIPGFLEWFMNKEEERERLKYLFNKGLDTIENILDNPEANANAKANIIKMLAEMNGYLGKKPIEKFADESINKMSEAQLKEFLERKGVTITQEKIIDARTESTNSTEEENNKDFETEEG